MIQGNDMDQEEKNTKEEETKDDLKDAVQRKAAGKEEECPEDGQGGTDAGKEPEQDAVSQDQDGQEASPEEERDSTPGGETKRSLFGRKKDKAVRKLEERVAELEDTRMRQLAEFENFRKRSEKEKNRMFDVGARSVVEKILPVLDNFERGLDGVPEEEKGTPFAEGISMVYKQMLTVLDEIGVKPIEAVGKEFDPNFHNAVMTVEDEELESGTVAEELQKGYLYQDSVVRHSMVKVVA